MGVVARVMPDGQFLCSEVFELGKDAQISLEEDGSFSAGEFDEQSFIDRMRMMGDGTIIIKELVEGFSE